MYNLKDTTALVKSILEQHEECRNSDSFLYLKVLRVIAREKNITLEFMTIPDFLANYHGNQFPPFESVRRARQKLQAANPELSACEKVEEARMVNEAEYRAFAKEVI